MMPEGFLPNKGNITLKQYEHFKDEKNYDSFIIGSSVSINHWLDDWKEFLPEGASPYHFDFSVMTIRQMELALDHILDNSTTKNILLVLTNDFPLWHDEETTAFKTPWEVERRAWDKFLVNFYYFKLFYNKDFLSNYLSDTVLKREVIGKKTNTVLMSNDIDYYNPEYNEERVLSREKELDSLFSRFVDEKPDWERELHYSDDLICNVNSEEKDIESMRRIQNRLSNTDIDYRIIMVPNRLGKKLNPADERKMYDIFGNKFINLTYEFDYLTKNPYLWYDNVHYRPIMASKIMERVYENEK